jgi:hypothetical protein
VKCFPIESEDKIRNSAQRKNDPKSGDTTLRNHRVSRTTFQSNDPKVRFPRLGPKAGSRFFTMFRSFRYRFFTAGDFSRRTPRDSVHVGFQSRRFTGR